MTDHVMTALQLLVFTSASVLTSTSTVEIGNATAFLSGLRGVVNKMELDQANAGHLMYVDQRSMWTMDMNTKQAFLIAGSWKRGYKEGSNGDAVFSEITGFTQISPYVIVVVDNANHCLRLIHRDKNITSSYSGVCLKYGNKDGYQALYNRPSDVVSTGSFTSQLFVTDRENSCIRRIDMVYRYTTTVHCSSDQDKWVYPRYLAISPMDTMALLTSSWHQISSLVYERGNVSYLSLVGSLEAGYQDGALQTAMLADPYQIQPLPFTSQKLFIIADHNNSRLRIVDYRNNSIRTLCPAQGDCKFTYPHSLLLIGNYLYVGGHNSILSVPIKFNL